MRGSERAVESKIGIVECEVNKEVRWEIFSESGGRLSFFSEVIN